MRYINEYNLWVTEKSEKMLIKHWITTSRGFEKTSVEVSIEKEHSNCTSKDRE